MPGDPPATDPLPDTPAGDLALGWYSTAYKLIDGLQITLAQQEIGGKCK